MRKGYVGLIAVLAVGFGGCRTAQLTEKAAPVRLVFTEPASGRCDFVANLVGSEGHWYNYLFISNDVLTIGAMNRLLNQAANAEADTVFVPRLVNQFKTSVTIFAQAYRCRDRSAAELNR